MNPKNGRKWRRMGKREDSTLKLREREREDVGVEELDAIARKLKFSWLLL